MCVSSSTLNGNSFSHTLQVTTEDNKLIEETQHGSRSGPGTITQLLRQHDLILEKLSSHDNVDVAYLEQSLQYGGLLDTSK